MPVSQARRASSAASVLCPGIRVCFGAAQHRLRQGRLVALALCQCRCLIRFGGDRLLAPALQQRLVRPIGVLRHEVGDLVRRRAAGCQQAEIGDQLGGDRVGIGSGGELRVGPAIGADRGHRIRRLRQCGCRGEQAEQAKRGQIGARMPLSSPGRPCDASPARLAFHAAAASGQTQGRGSCSRDRSLL